MTESAVTAPSWKTKNRSLFTVWSNGDDKKTSSGKRKSSLKDMQNFPKNDSSIPKEVEKDKIRVLSLSDPDPNDRSAQLKQADRYIQQSYNLVWGTDHSNHSHAIDLLGKAVDIQTICLGKHHPDVGWTINFIGTAYWRLSLSKQVCGNRKQKQQIQHCMSALQYYMEASRILCKASDQTDSHHPPVSMERPNEIASIEQRIHCILSGQMGWDSKQATRLTSTLQQRINHELQGDWWKAKGDQDRAETHYRKARQFSNTIEKHIVQP